MKRQSHGKWGIVILLACLFLALPSEARADAINFPLLLVYGSVVLIPLMAFVVFVESGFLARGMLLPYRMLLKPVLEANIISLVAGVPVKIFNAFMYASILPRDLASYFKYYPLAGMLGTAIYFVVTLITEYFMIKWWCIRKSQAIAAGRLALFVFVANLVTYAVLAPAHYFAARPIHDIHEFTDSSDWALQPPTTIYYKDKTTGYLCSVSSNGQGKKELITEEVKDYQFMPDSGIILYRNATNALCLSKIGSPTKTASWKTDQRYLMEQVAASPDGKCVAYLKRIGELKPYRLMLYDTASDRTIDTDITTSEKTYAPAIAWSTSPSILFLMHMGTVEVIHIEPDFSARVMNNDPTNTPFANVYGRFSDSHWFSGADWGASFPYDEAGTTTVRAYSGLESHIRVTRNGETFILADNPGLLKLGKRWFGNVCILENKRELIFDDRSALYLMDMDRRIVGKIADGSKFIILSDRYKRKRGKKQ